MLFIDVHDLNLWVVKRDIIDVIKTKDLKMGRVSWVIPVDPI